MKSKLLPVLLIALVAAGGAFVVLRLPEWQQQQKMQGVNDRMNRTAIVRRAIMAIEKESKKWPETEAEIRATELGKQIPGDMKITKGTVEKDGATYKVVDGSRTLDIKIPPTVEGQTPPSGPASMTGAG